MKLKPFLLATALLSPCMAQAATFEPYGVAILQATDKVSGHAEKITVPVGQDTRFGNLFIGVRACRKTPPEELPESVAFLEISEIQPNQPVLPSGTGAAKTWFSGWMFASNPSLAALEHPVYDIAVVNCQKPLGSQVDDQSAVPVASPAANAPTKAALPAVVPSAKLAN